MENNDFNCSFVNWDSFNNCLGENKLSLLCVNARSIFNKFGEFLGHIKLLKYRITFIVIVESWLKLETDVALEIPGYKSCSLYRSGNRVGAV